MYNFSKRWNVESLRNARSKKKLPMLRTVNLEEAAAAETAGIDLLSVPPELVMDKRLREVAPNAFLVPGDNFWTIGGPNDYMKWAFSLFEHGADCVYCQGSLKSVKVLAERKTGKL